MTSVGMLSETHVCAQAGSPLLRRMLEGHCADLSFMAGCLVANALRKVALAGRILWHQRPSCGTWLHSVQKWLDSLGWLVVGPCTGNIMVVDFTWNGCSFAKRATGIHSMPLWKNYFTSSYPRHDIYTFCYWQTFWHSIWHIFWHSIWHIFWHIF